MKTLLLSFLVPVALLFAGSTKPIDKERCSCGNIPLYGNVKVVQSLADFDVRVVESLADLDVKIVSSSPNGCGEWRFVESLPDFTIRFVESSEDFSIRFVESMPGAR